jgi:hypothetical protein
MTFTNDEEKQDFLYANWIYETDLTPQQLFQSVVHCIHCNKEHLLADFRVVSDTNFKYIMCPDENCSGSLIDLKIVSTDCEAA